MMLSLVARRLASMGECGTILWGALAVVAVGLGLGFATPVASDLAVHVPWGRISNVIGWTYFAAWTVSFYPQAISNYRRQSVTGMSFDYQLLNIIGYAFYSTFNALLFWDHDVQDEYRKRHNGKQNQVQASDVFFAVHAFAMTAVILVQIMIYPRGGQKLSKVCLLLSTTLIALTTIFTVVVAVRQRGFFVWINLLEFMADAKLFVTLIKYVPQAWMNYRRKSTVGVSIHNFLLDFTGGTLSVAQLLMDCGITSDWSAITGDVAKFGLGSVSMLFDVVFLVQHYGLYRDRFDAMKPPPALDAKPAERRPLLHVQATSASGP